MKKKLTLNEVEAIKCTGGARGRFESLYDRVRSPSRSRRNKSRGQYRRAAR